MSKNCNLKTEVICPNCNNKRLARNDVIKKVLRAGRELVCKPCRNKTRFIDKPHPRKGTGVKNSPELLFTRNSYYKAKRRCKLGIKHHKCYEDIEFKFDSLQQLIDEIGIRQEGTTLDRINPLGNYEPGNVRWATPKQQCENRMPKGYWKN